MMDWNKCRVDHGKNLKLSKTATFRSEKTSGKYSSNEKLEIYFSEIDKLQSKLFAENRQSLLIIFQGMDSSGKDGTIKHIMQGLNPQGAIVTSFKHPSTIELEHDYLWRHVNKLPEHGQIAIFNRSHYENVLICKVHPKLILSERLPGIENIDQIDKAFWNNRYKQIKHFEKNMIQSGTHILKFFLHISKEEQRKRFLDRIVNKEKHWKFSSDDITERGYWLDYQYAYEEAIKNTSTKCAPWHVIPADNKSLARLFITKIILEKLKSMKPAFPLIDKKEKVLMKLAEEKLRRK